jgi:hypothetical protein
MRRAFFTATSALLPILAAFQLVSSQCLAWDTWNSCCSCCSNYRANCTCCRYCDAICNYRLVDGCTKCAWKRTWHAPNALDTPLRQYYIPRPPACCWSAGWASGCGCGGGNGYDSFDYLKCQCQNNNADRPPIVADVDTGFAPVQFQRLGQVRNELDVAGAAIAPPAHAAGQGR